MILFVLIFACEFFRIMGRPHEVTSLNENTIPPWPLTKDMFLLPRILEVDEKINITVTTKNTTQEVNISLMAKSSDKSEPDVICSFDANIATRTANIIYNNTFGEQEMESIEMEHFITQNPEETDPTLIFSVQFKRRKSAMTSDANVLEIATSSQITVRHLDKIRYLKFEGDDDSKVSNIQFDFL